MASLTDRLYWDSGRLQCNGQEVTLRTKGLTVLRYLMDHPGRVVDKETLLTACWPDVEVSPHALKVCIREIRAALRDDVAMPRFIETIPRQGYRFIGAIVRSQSSVVNVPPALSLRSRLATGNWQLTPHLVGREAELAQLHGWLETAFSGQRQMVFVIGEPGIGKTTLVDAFLTQVATDGRFLVARGQCLEQYVRGW